MKMTTKEMKKIMRIHAVHKVLLKGTKKQKGGKSTSKEIRNFLVNNAHTKVSSSFLLMRTMIFHYDDIVIII